MKCSKALRILILGYGNPGRQDDGLGPSIIEELEELNLPDVTLDADYQLNIEDAVALAEHDRVIFVDAALDGKGPYLVKRVEPSSTISFTTHAVAPESVLAICFDTYKRVPEAVLIGVRGYAFDMAEGLSRKALANRRKAIDFIKSLIQEWKTNAAV